MKPNKISAMLEAWGWTLDPWGQALYPADAMVLDLCKGFSRSIFLKIRSEEEDVDYYFPGFVDRHIEARGDMVDFGRALYMGLLEIADDNDKAVPIMPVEKELEDLDAMRQESHPEGRRNHPLKRINARLLDRLRQCLLPARQYKLRFCGTHFTIWSKFGNRESIDPASLTPSEWSEDVRVQMTCDPEPLLFTVVPGVQIPRFTVSFEISSSSCYLNDPYNFNVLLTVTSLEDRPVTVDRLSDRIERNLDPDEPHHRWNRKSPLDSFNILDEKTKQWSTLHSNVDRVDKGSSIEDKLAVRLLEFNKGTSHTRLIEFSREELSSHENTYGNGFAGLTPEKTYTMVNRIMGYVIWNYGHAHELVPEGNWKNHGPIIFEPVSAVARTIEMIFERERPRPFFRLPRELRDQVYEYVKRSERANEARFTVKKGR
ncbi:hypothetical protein IMSHALPRED_009373 [Imshaugia aleurites]|uniref:Uncharacterized protein n=1 Tax=Imshaugia aleurites TaxID=172621 RepID=A0A8H3IYT5_9LECA|nr:hypothetical protein IMSHALPRED_009373 [Imshaugia aleurites]